MDEPNLHDQPVLGDGLPQIEGLEPGMTIIRRVRGPRRWPGFLACVLAVAMLVATGSSITLSAELRYALATDLAYVAIALSVAAAVVGLVSIFGRWGRPAGIAGLIVAVLGNPLVLLYGLNYFGGR